MVLGDTRCGKAMVLRLEIQDDDDIGEGQEEKLLFIITDALRNHPKWKKLTINAEEGDNKGIVVLTLRYPSVP